MLSPIATFKICFLQTSVMPHKVSWKIQFALMSNISRTKYNTLLNILTSNANFHALPNLPWCILNRNLAGPTASPRWFVQPHLLGPGQDQGKWVTQKIPKNDPTKFRELFSARRWSSLTGRCSSPPSPTTRWTTGITNSGMFGLVLNKGHLTKVLPTQMMTFSFAASLSPNLGWRLLHSSNSSWYNIFLLQ